MALKLRVISDHYKVLGKRSSQLFGVTGGRIGRAQDNDWILPDPDRYVSSHHCTVSFRSGEWVLEDTSTNGVFINGSDIPASVEGARALQDGDRLRLGDYEIIVSIDARNDFPSDASGQMPALPKGHRAAPKRDDDLGEELDLADLLSDSLITEAPELTTKPARFPARHGRDAPRVDSVLDLADALYPEPATPLPGPSRANAPAGPSASSPPPKVAQGGFKSLLGSNPDEGEQRTVAHARTPEDWQMQTQPWDRRTMAPAAAPRQERAEPEPSARRNNDPGHTEVGSGVEAFCRGAGIDPSKLPADNQSALLTIAGQMVREVVLGLMDVLKARADLKSRLHLNQTTIQPAENNPLKFSASVDEAVMKLLDPHGTRYLGPIESIRDSFSDLRIHQSALNAAILAAIDEIMNRIEPSDLQERFDRGLKRGALLGAANKMKYWDLYSEFYQVLNQRNEQGLPTLFAEELARTYTDRSTTRTTSRSRT